MPGEVVVVFQGDDVVLFGTSGWHGPLLLASGRSSASHLEIPPGEYIVVSCAYTIWPDNNFGITEINVLKLALPKPASFSRPSSIMREARKLESVSIEESSTDELTAQQRENTIDAINEVNRTMWPHATREVKESMQAGVSKKDEAYELSREGMANYKKGNLSEASRLIQAGLEICPEMKGARANLGKIAIDAGQIDKAIEWFNEELEMDPNNLSAHMYLATIYDAMGDKDSAERHARSAVATEEYRRAPTVLMSDVVQKIRSQAAAYKQKTSITNEEKTEKAWWKFKR